MLSDDTETPGSIEPWRISALRIMLISGYTLYAIIGIHSCLSAIGTNVFYLVPITIGFYLLATIQICLARHYYYISAYSLLASIILAAICINAVVKVPILAMLGPVFVFSPPLVAFVLLGSKAGFVCMLLNIIPFIALLNGFQLSQFINDHILLEHANAYIISIIFLFFNVCVPLAVARAGVSLKRMNLKIMAQNKHLQAQHNFYKTLFVETEIAKLVVNHSGQISEMNQAAERLLQCEFNQLARPVALQQLFDGLNPDDNQTIVNRSVQGRLKSFQLSRSSLFDDAYYFVTIQDVTAKAMLHKTLAAQTLLNKKQNLDEATGFPSRIWLENKLRSLLHEPQAEVCLISFEISNSQYIEQKYGFVYLALVLKKIAEQWQNKTYISSHIATIDSCHLGVVTELSILTAKTYLGHFMNQLPRVVIIEQQKIPLDIKVGIAFSDTPERNPEKLINNALYAVSSTSLPINIYETASLERFIEHNEINILLNEALTNNELSLVYQPKVKGDGKVIGLEALLRWNSPVIGSMSPSVFIPIAEKSGLVPQITQWLINHVCQQISLWQQAGLHVVPVAINISGPDLDQEAFHETLVNSLVEMKIEPRLIEIELTESAISRDINKALATTRYLANWGFCITLDDFGVGYSGLSKLISYPVNRVKIDRQFIKNIHKEERKAKVVEAITAMCKVFNIEVLAEGVESLDEVDKLLLLGCASFQGFAFSKPLDKVQTTQLLKVKNVLHFNQLKTTSR